MDPDQSAPQEQSDQSLHCLPFHEHFRCINFALLNQTVPFNLNVVSNVSIFC